jgi:hypothetical protein
MTIADSSAVDFYRYRDNIAPMKQSCQNSVSRIGGDQLIVRFNYTPQRVEAIKSFPRSRYEPKTRSWKGTHYVLSSCGKSLLTATAGPGQIIFT